MVSILWFSASRWSSNQSISARSKSFVLLFSAVFKNNVLVDYPNNVGRCFSHINVPQYEFMLLATVAKVTQPDATRRCICGIFPAINIVSVVNLLCEKVSTPTPRSAPAQKLLPSF